eukprot:Clim_evm5s143 gene=Clim_evmTU5s143
MPELVERFQNLFRRRNNDEGQDGQDRDRIFSDTYYGQVGGQYLSTGGAGTYIFGQPNDLNALSRGMAGPRLAPPPPNLKGTAVMKALFNVRKETIKLTPVEDLEQGLYSLSFEFDALEPCTVSVFLGAKEVYSQGILSYKQHVEGSEGFAFPEGMRHAFGKTEDGPQAVLEITKLPEDQWEWNTEIGKPDARTSTVSHTGTTSTIAPTSGSSPSRPQSMSMSMGTGTGSLPLPAGVDEEGADVESPAADDDNNDTGSSSTERPAPVRASRRSEMLRVARNPFRRRNNGENGGDDCSEAGSTQLRPPTDIPLVILIESADSQQGTDSVQQFQQQATYCRIGKLGNGEFYAGTVKQKLVIGNLVFVLQEIYGLEQKAQTENQDEEDQDEDFDTDDNRDCVICMSEARDTMVLPCRHLCLCDSCAEVLRYQSTTCPICRAPFHSMLQVRSMQEIKEEDGTATPGVASDAPNTDENSGAAEHNDDEHEELDEDGNPIVSIDGRRYATVPIVEARVGEYATVQAEH